MSSTVPLPVINQDGDTKAQATISRGGEIIQAHRLRRAGGVIATALAPWYFDASTGGGSVAVVGGAAIVSSGTAVAPRGRLESKHRCRTILPQSNHCTIVAQVSNGLLDPGGRFRFGAFDDQDGFFIEVLTGAPDPRIVSRKASVDTVVSPPFGQIQPLTIDTQRHAYTIRYLVTIADFLQDGIVRHTMTSGIANPLPLVVNADFPVRVEAENLSSAGTNFQITVANASISRLGDEVGSATAAITRIATSTASFMLADTNPMRRAVIIHNDSNNELRIKYGIAASPTSYTYVLAPQDGIEIDGMEWCGRIDGILMSGTGNAQVTETQEI
jgi:hypothetical protein